MFAITLAQERTRIYRDAKLSPLAIFRQGRSDPKCYFISVLMKRGFLLVFLWNGVNLIQQNKYKKIPKITHLFTNYNALVWRRTHLSEKCQWPYVDVTIKACHPKGKCDGDYGRLRTLYSPYLNLFRGVYLKQWNSLRKRTCGYIRLDWPILLHKVILTCKRCSLCSSCRRLGCPCIATVTIFIHISRPFYLMSCPSLLFKAEKMNKWYVDCFDINIIFKWLGLVNIPAKFKSSVIFRP